MTARWTIATSPRSARRSPALGIEAVAILFLHCYRNPDHEIARQEAARGASIPDLFVSASHELSQEYREFERYLDRRRQRLCRPEGAVATCAASTSTSAAPGFKGSFLVVQSTGGLYEADQAQSLLRAHAGVRARPPA